MLSCFVYCALKIRARVREQKPGASIINPSDASLLSLSVTLAKCDHPRVRLCGEGSDLCQHVTAHEHQLKEEWRLHVLEEEHWNTSPTPR